MRAYICRLLLECSLRSNLTTVSFFLLYFFVFKPVQNNPVIILLHLMFDEVQLRLTLSLTDLRQCHQSGWIGSSQRGLRCDALIFSLTPAALCRSSFISSRPPSFCSFFLFLVALLVLIQHLQMNALSVIVLAGIYYHLVSAATSTAFRATQNQSECSFFSRKYLKWIWRQRRSCDGIILICVSENGSYLHQRLPVSPGVVEVRFGRCF